MDNILLITRNFTNQQKEHFNQKLHEIEQRHLTWFKQRPAMFDQQKHDSLTYHTFSQQYGNTFSFIFWRYSDLPESIKNDCIMAFQETFESRQFA